MHALSRNIRHISDISHKCRYHVDILFDRPIQVLAKPNYIIIIVGHFQSKHVYWGDKNLKLP